MSHRDAAMVPIFLFTGPFKMSCFQFSFR
uniref:Uncharacterized protein n=1 Tax=Anguilla anguilla TaxID=7936 RepID=A0A0E9T6T8_ANGAN